VQPALQQWTVGSSVTHLRNYLSQLDVPFEDIQRYLVYRIPGTAEPPVPPPPSSSTPVQESLVHAEQVETTAVPEVKARSFLPLTLCQNPLEQNLLIQIFVSSTNFILKIMLC
jgi:hypothetical protein